jgi:hypothetical protein
MTMKVPKVEIDETHLNDPFYVRDKLLEGYKTIPGTKQGPPCGVCKGNDTYSIAFKRFGRVSRENWCHGCGARQYRGEEWAVR